MTNGDLLAKVNELPASYEIEEVLIIARYKMQ